MTDSKDRTPVEDQIVQLMRENRHLRENSELVREAVLFATHEWRNCLSRVALASEQLVRVSPQTLTNQQHDVVQRIRQTMAEMERITRNYLDSALLQDSAFQPHARFVDPVREIVTPVIASFKDALDESHQICEVRVSRPGLLVWADPELLATVYENLLGNAIKYGEHGGQIRLEVYERGSRDAFRVWNTGPGISEADLECIFDRLSRGANCGSQRGLGVGLYLARRIIEAHKGRLWAESKLGAWASFNFTLPRRGAAFTDPDASRDSGNVKR